MILEDNTSTFVTASLLAMLGAGGELVSLARMPELRAEHDGLAKSNCRSCGTGCSRWWRSRRKLWCAPRFSTSSREAGDISAGVFDLDGRMLAQAVTGTPGHINTMARSVGHFLEVFPVARMQEGDVYVTNDPWKGTGHLYDLVVVSPAFMDGRLVGLFASTAHLVDMGGVGQPGGPSDLARGAVHSVAAAGRAGEMNEDLLAMIRANVREPVR